MTPPISYIFNKSSCLGSRQMSAYIKGTMSHEEQHAAEHHLNSCLLCSSAVAGLQEGKGDALRMASSLNSGFLRSYLHTEKPHHQVAPPEPIRTVRRKSRLAKTYANTSGTFAPVISAVIILFAYLAWQRPDISKARPAKAPVAMEQQVAQAVVIPVAPRTKKDVAEEDAQLITAVTEQEATGEKASAAPRRVSIQAAGVLPTDADAALVKVLHKPATAKAAQPASRPAAKTETAVVSEEQEHKGMEEFKSENWAGAYNSFKQEMHRGDTDHREEATLMAAKSLHKLGKDDEAKQLLTELADGEGDQRRAAKKMLRRMNNDNE